MQGHEDTNIIFEDINIIFLCSSIPSRESWADSGWKAHPIPPPASAGTSSTVRGCSNLALDTPKDGEATALFLFSSLFPNFKIPLFLFLWKDGFWQSLQESLWNFDQHCQGQRWLIVLSTKLILQKTNPRARKSCKDILDANITCWIEESMQKDQKKIRILFSWGTHIIQSVVSSKVEGGAAALPLGTLNHVLLFFIQNILK